MIRRAGHVLIGAAVFGVWLLGIFLLSERQPVPGVCLVVVAVIGGGVLARVRNGGWKGATSTIIEAIAEIIGNR